MVKVTKQDTDKENYKKIVLILSFYLCGLKFKKVYIAVEKVDYRKCLQ